MKNLIIGYGETLTKVTPIPKGGGKKNYPYTFEEAKQYFVQDLSMAIKNMDNRPADSSVNDEFVLSFVQHPSFLAKSYYPSRLFDKYNIKDLGSKPVKIEPRKWAVKDHPQIGLASSIFVSGTKHDFENLMLSLDNPELPENIKQAIKTFEKVCSISAEEKIKGIGVGKDALRLEVVLHADENSSDVRIQFDKYLSSLDGKAEWELANIIGGLTFLPVNLRSGKETELAQFSHLRVLRSVPELRIFEPQVKPSHFDEYSYAINFNTIVKPSSADFKVCIFDGGIGDNTAISHLVNEIIPEDVQGDYLEFLTHGSEVCSSYLFGPINDNDWFPAPYTTVDIVRVLSPFDHDQDLFKVLARIKAVLTKKEYKYVNISLGPRLSIDDDEVHVWTSVLDSLLQDGHCLAVVAVGNDGHLSGDLARIQPPSDMVNCLAVGSADSKGPAWKKASYSCLGPGRSPGIIKPDGLIFGGSEAEPFKLYSPISKKVVATAGTSYAAPYVMRVAAGVDAITDFNLHPSTVKALLIHAADRGEHSFEEAGWGLFPNTSPQVIECLDDEAIIVYQGELKKSQNLRIPIPLPDDIDCTWVHLKATFCFNAVTDPEHPLHYTRSGLEITFRANDSKYSSETSEHADTKKFFSLSNLYDTEEQLRDDAHKWETTLSKKMRFKRSTLSNPVLDVKYHAREQGGDSQEPTTPLKYSLVVSIRAEGNTNTYNSVLQQNQTLQAIKVSNQIQV